MSTQANFFSSVTAFAKPFVKSARAVSKDPLVVAKTKFGLVADEQIKLIKAAADKGFWFTKNGEDFIITLKNGAATLNAEHPSFALSSAANAVKFLEQAKTACAAGEFDALFTATARKVKAKEAGEAAAGAATAPAAAGATGGQKPSTSGAKSKK